MREIRFNPIPFKADGWFFDSLLQDEMRRQVAEMAMIPLWAWTNSGIERHRRTCLNPATLKRLTRNGRARHAAIKREMRGL